jgi:putative flippase GtrA
MRMLGPAWLAIPRPLRFVAVGGVNTLFGYAAYATLLAVGLHYAAASFFGTIAAVTFNYFTTGGLVFGGLSRAALVRFVAAYVALYLVNVAALAALVRAGVDPYVGGLVLLAPMALLSYVAMRTFVFGSGRGAN